MVCVQHKLKMRSKLCFLFKPMHMMLMRGFGGREAREACVFDENEKKRDLPAEIGARAENVSMRTSISHSAAGYPSNKD
jgi:hypothetical protein